MARDLSISCPISNRLDQVGQVFAIAAFLQRLSQDEQLVAINEPEPESDFLQARNFHSLPRLERLHEACSIDQRFERSRTKPRKTASHPFDVKCAGRQIARLQVGYFKLPPRGRLDLRGMAHDVVVKEIQARDRPI